jgi:RNA polymerase sigma factor (sigma-70 family)
VLLAGYLNESGTNAGEDALARLTGREREVLQLISEGKTNKEIARILSLSINTVESHRKHVMEKLDLHNTAEIVRFAVRKGIVQ